MQQMDFLDSNKDLYLYSEIEKVRDTSNRQLRALFAIVAELKKGLNELTEKRENDEKSM